LALQKQIWQAIRFLNDLLFSFEKNFQKKSNHKIFFIDVRFVAQTYIQSKNKKTFMGVKILYFLT